MAALPVADSFQNLLAGMGAGANSLQSNSTYTFAFWSRNRVLLEAMYRGSWVISKAVNIFADDMTRAGIEVSWPTDESASDKINRAFRRLHIWSALNSGIRWARLFGGAIGVLMVDGQAPETPLRLETIGKGQFKGLHVIDRWLLTPSSEIVQEYGAHFGKPESYLVAAGNNVPFSGRRIHYTRVIRFEGLELPYFQRMAENGWGMSVVEPIYDRMVAFDTATAGTSNLIHKAHLRVVQIEGLRNLIAQGGDILKGVIANLKMIRELQTNEGLTLLDTKDIFTAHNYTYAGLSDVIWQFAQQIAGAVDCPLVRFFGASPGGLGSNGESEMRTHYDRINQDQERSLRDPLSIVIGATAQSEGLGLPPPDMDFHFNPLWQLSDSEKANIAQVETNTILAGLDAGIISNQMAMRELQQSSRVTGLWTSITNKDVDEAEADIPDPMEIMQQTAEIQAKAKGAAGGEAKPDEGSSQPSE